MSRIHAPAAAHEQAASPNPKARGPVTAAPVAPSFAPETVATYFEPLVPLASPLYPKLHVGDPQDPAERAADAFAARVMGGEGAGWQGASEGAGVLHRKCSACAEEEGTLHRKESAGGGGLAPPVVHQALAAPGHALDTGAAAQIESRGGLTLEGVRIHTDALAAESARAVGAKAYTVGRDIVFGAGEYQPSTPEGLRLIAHEVGHLGDGVVRREVSARSLPLRIEGSREFASIRKFGSPYHVARFLLSRLGQPVRDDEVRRVQQEILRLNPEKVNGLLFKDDVSVAMVPIVARGPEVVKPQSEPLSGAAVDAVDKIKYNTIGELFTTTKDMLATLKGLSAVDLQNVLASVSTEQKKKIMEAAAREDSNGEAASGRHTVFVNALAQSGQLRAATQYLQWLEAADPAAYQASASNIQGLRANYPSILTESASDGPDSDLRPKTMIDAKPGESCDLRGTKVENKAVDDQNPDYRWLMGNLKHPGFAPTKDESSFFDSVFGAQKSVSELMGMLNSGTDLLIAQALNRIDKSRDSLVKKSGSLPVVGQMLGPIVDMYTRQHVQSLHFAAGAIKGAERMATGTVGMVVHPFDTINGLAEMTLHSTTGAKLVVLIVANEVGASRAVDKIWKDIGDDVHFWKELGSEIANEHCEKRSTDGKSCEQYDKAQLAGRIGFELFMLRDLVKGKGPGVPKALEEAGEASNAAKASRSRAGKSPRLPKRNVVAEVSEPAAEGSRGGRELVPGEGSPEVSSTRESVHTHGEPKREVMETKGSETSRTPVEDAPVIRDSELRHPEDAPGDTRPHELRVGEHVELCSHPCHTLWEIYAAELEANPQLAQELRKIESKTTSSRRGVSKSDSDRLLKFANKLAKIKNEKIAPPVDLGERAAGFRKDLDQKLANKGTGSEAYTKNEAGKFELKPKYDRRHEISSKHIVEMIEAVLNGRTLEERAHILRRISSKYEVKSPLTKEAVDGAARKWYLDEFNNDERIWAGSASENRSVGEWFDESPDRSPAEAKDIRTKLVRYRRIRYKSMFGPKAEPPKEFILGPSR